MLAYFIVGVLLAGGITYAAYYFLQDRVLKEALSIDDGKGYFLISVIVIAFAMSGASFFIGQTFGFDTNEQDSGLMALCILFNIMTALAVLIYGLVRFREPEHY